MIQTTQTSYYYPNKMGRIILLALGEILGQDEFSQILQDANLSKWIAQTPPNNLEKAFPFDDLAGIQASIEARYGIRGGQGLALRAGRATFKYGLREFGPMLGITDMAFRLLPLPQKLSAGARLFAETFNKYTDQVVRIEETASEIHWIIERCPVCWGRETEKPTCSLAVGLLQEALYWISGGRHFIVEEITCIAQGDPNCTIVVQKGLS